MGLFDRFKKKKLFDKDGNPIAQVVIEEKDLIYAPCPGTGVFLEDAPLTGDVPEGAAGMALKPSAGVIFAPLTGDVTFDDEHNEIRIENFLDVHLLVRVLPLEKAEGEKIALKQLAAEGAHVHVGDPLATFELAELGENASVVVLVENADDFAGVQPASDGETEALDSLLVVLRK